MRVRSAPLIRGTAGRHSSGETCPQCPSTHDDRARVGRAQCCEPAAPAYSGPAWVRVPGSEPDTPWIARQTASGVSGMSMCRTPRWESASTTALCTAGVDPIVPDSPMPFAPMGLRRVGVSVFDASNDTGPPPTGCV